MESHAASIGELRYATSEQLCEADGKPKTEVYGGLLAREMTIEKTAADHEEGEL